MKSSHSASITSETPRLPSRAKSPLSIDKECIIVLVLHGIFVKYRKIGFSLLLKLDPHAPTAYWINIPERDGWLLVNVEGRKVGIIVSVTEGGQAYLTVVGYHAGETKFVGEKQNVLSIKIEPIGAGLRDPFLTLVRNALPPELKSLPIDFL